ncbi:MAG: ABC transporter substrate-binding protein [Lachnospiraceae bacterium]|nr:ABC transporter substrate-binding protein [Lachnospiraceae bacterium]
MVLSLTACSGNTGSSAGGQASENASSSTDVDEAKSTDEETSEGADADAEKSGTVSVTCLNGSGEEIQVEVPYDAQRVVAVDFANLDILDNLGLGDRIVGAPNITLDYLQAYGENDDIVNVGTVKTPDLEAVMSCRPDIIFMAGRAAEYYDALTEIAPVVRLISDTNLGLVETVRKNATTIASIFGKEDQVSQLLAQYDSRIESLAALAEGKTALVGMCTTGSFNLLGNDGRCSLIVNEIGFDNIGADAATAGSSRSGGRGGENSGRGGEDGESSSEDTGESRESQDESQEGSDSGSTPTHGNEASFELVLSLNPDYIFVMDRDAAIATNGAQMAQEIMENELVMKTDAYQNGNLIILDHPGVWYTGEGGITALDYMLSDLENALQ